MASAVSSPARVATNPSRLLSPRVARAAAAADTASRQRRLAGREVSSSGRRRASAWSASRANDDDDDDDDDDISRRCRSRTNAAAATATATARDDDDAPNALASKVVRVMREHDIVRRGDVVVACVSGGPDSVALLHLLRELSDEWNLAVHVLHCNHGKRSASEEEETFVVEMCERLGVDVHVRRPEAPWGSSHFQERAREWRRKEARALARDVDARVILQAHHWDDQVETILLKILRGCHLSNIKGMMYVNGDVGRPLLDCRKDELVRVLARSRRRLPRRREQRRRDVLEEQNTPRARAAAAGAHDAADERHGHVRRASESDDATERAAASVVRRPPEMLRRKRKTSSGPR